MRIRLGPGPRQRGSSQHLGLQNACLWPKILNRDGLFLDKGGSIHRELWIRDFQCEYLRTQVWHVFHFCNEPIVPVRKYSSPNPIELRSLLRTCSAIPAKLRVCPALPASVPHHCCDEVESEMYWDMSHNSDPKPTQPHRATTACSKSRTRRSSKAPLQRMPSCRASRTLAWSVDNVASNTSGKKRKSARSKRKESDWDKLRHSFASTLLHKRRILNHRNCGC